MAPLRRSLRPLLILLALLAGVGAGAGPAAADPLLAQWRQGLRGTRLTAYDGSAIRSHSTLTVVRLCRDGRFHYRREGSWSLPGVAGGANQGIVTGRWSVERGPGGGIEVHAVTDAGERYRYPAFLRGDGKVSLGGVAYAAERGAAGC